jgi:hypothetical protein
VRRLAELIAFAFMACIGPVCAAENELVLVKARIVVRDPEAQQPQWECKSDDPKVEMICLFVPVSFTFDIRDVLIGHKVPRRFHAILSIDPEPSHTADLYIVGRRSAAGEIEVSQWGYFNYVGCPAAMGGLSTDFDSEAEVADLRRTGHLPCIKN